MKGFILATAVLMSTIVGVGMFGLPYVGTKSGFLIIAIFLFILTIAMTLIHLFYGEIISRTKGKHRLPGYAGRYLGERAKKIVGFFVIGGFYGSLLVYIVVGGSFLYTILSPIVNLPLIVFNLVFFIIGSAAVYFGLKLITGLDLLMGLFLILIVFLFLYFGFNYIDISNLKTINWRNAIVPYGVILYSLAGLVAVPEIRNILSDTEKKKHYKKVIILGTIIPAILYLVFIATTIGLTGKDTSLNAVSGLIDVLGSRVVLLGAVFGFLATITSFFALGLSLKETYLNDFGFRKNWAWFITCSIPLILFVLGVQNFVIVITILGALMGIVECVSIVLIHRKSIDLGDKEPDYKVRIPFVIRYLIIAVFVIGFVYTIFSLIFSNQ